VALARMARMRRPDLPVVFLTGYDIPGIQQELFGPVLAKPVDNTVLIQAIQETLASPCRGPAQ